MNFVNSDDNTLTDSIAFETYVIEAMDKYLEAQKKTAIIKNQYDFVDAVLPDGIDDILGPVYLEIKYFNLPGKSIYFQSIIRFADAMQKIDDGNILFVIGTNVTDKSLESMKSLFHSRCDKNIEIWTLDFFEEKTKKYRNRNFFDIKNPHSIVVDDAINNPKSSYDSKKAQNMLLDSLKKKYDNQEIALFLGAGVSIDSGIPLWDDLLNSLLAKMISYRLKDSTLSENQLNMIISLASANQDGTSITQMRYIRSAFENEEYNRIVHDALYEKKVKLNTKLLVALSSLCTPSRTKIGIKGIVTYNFDDIIERRLKKDKVDYNTIYNEQGVSTPERLSVFHVHGFLPQHKVEEVENPHLIFSEEDYHKVYTDAYCWSNIVQLNYLRENTCLFIGCSLNDPNLRRLLDVASRGNEKPRHFAFMKKPSIKSIKGINKQDIELYKQIDISIRNNCYSSMGINVIWIDDYKEITDILRWIKGNKTLNI